MQNLQAVMLICMAKAAAAWFDEYCAKKFKKGSAGHDDWLPDDASAQGIPASVPAYDAQATVCSQAALAMWVSEVHERVRASVMYNIKHARAFAEVLPILDQIVCDADKIGSDHNHNCSTTGKAHWCNHILHTQ